LVKLTKGVAISVVDAILRFESCPQRFEFNAAFKSQLSEDPYVVTDIDLLYDASSHNINLEVFTTAIARAMEATFPGQDNRLKSDTLVENFSKVMYPGK